MPATQAARKREMIANLENDAYIKALVDEAYAVCWPFHVLYAGTTDPNKDKGALAQLVCPTPNDALHRNISAPAHRPIPALTRDVI